MGKPCVIASVGNKVFGPRNLLCHSNKTKIEKVASECQNTKSEVEKLIGMMRWSSKAQMPQISSLILFSFDPFAILV